MGAILDPTNHSTYFDEIRSLISPDHKISNQRMPDNIINQFGYLGRAETLVLRATNLVSTDLRPSDNNASTVPTDPQQLKKREYVFVIECLTAYFLLTPQRIQQGVGGDLTIRVEEIDINQRRRELAEKISDILPDVLTPDEPSDTDGVIGTHVITTPGIF